MDATLWDMLIPDLLLMLMEVNLLRAIRVTVLIKRRSINNRSRQYWEHPSQSEMERRQIVGILQGETLFESCSEHRLTELLFLRRKTKISHEFHLIHTLFLGNRPLILTHNYTWTDNKVRELIEVKVWIPPWSPSKYYPWKAKHRCQRLVHPSK